LATLIPLLHSDGPWGDITVSNTKYVQILIWPPVQLVVRPQLL